MTLDVLGWVGFALAVIVSVVTSWRSGRDDDGAYFQRYAIILLLLMILRAIDSMAAP